jgi:Kdo2-lipid IVA lauroyltransferase/acyltransferase
MRLISHEVPLQQPPAGADDGQPTASYRFGMMLVRTLAGLSFRARWWLARVLRKLNARGNPIAMEMTTTHLRWAFAQEPAPKRAALQHDNAVEMYFALLDRFRVWSLSEPALREQISLTGLDTLHRFVGRQPVVLLCPHFLGMEAAGMRLSLEVSAMILYRPSGSNAMEAMRDRARARFREQHLHSTAESLVPLVRRLRAGTPLLITPDLDSGASSAVFAPWFGVPAATSPLAAWCAMRAGAVMLPVSVRRVHEGRYAVRIHEPLPPLTGDITHGTQQINAAMESLIRAMPDQYWWAQPRYATRPPGSEKMYSDAVLAYARDAFGSAV